MPSRNPPRHLHSVPVERPERGSERRSSESDALRTGDVAAAEEHPTAHPVAGLLKLRRLVAGLKTGKTSTEKTSARRARRRSSAPELGEDEGQGQGQDPAAAVATPPPPRRDILAYRHSSRRVRGMSSGFGLSERASGMPSSSKLTAVVEDLEADDALPAVLLATLADDDLCDTALVGADGVEVRAPRYLLAAHSAALKGLLYPPAGGAEPPHQVDLAFAEWDALDAAKRCLVTRTLPPGLVGTANEFNVRALCQVHLFGRLFDIGCLVDRACNRVRTLVNQRPPLACAAFDECLRAEAKLSPAQRGSKYFVRINEVKEYALKSMRESAEETLLAQGTNFLTAASMEAILCDQEMDADETTMLYVLMQWVEQEEGNVEVGKRLVSHIHLCLMKPDHLNYVVRNCSFVPAAAVDDALREIEQAVAEQAPEDKEHVRVTGAGQAGVDGIYVRLEEDVGMDEGEVMFVQEAGDEDGGPEHSLFLFEATWAITLAADNSNVLYSCAAPPRSLMHCAPEDGWRAVKGADPPPTCAWRASKADRLAGKNYIAPNIADSGTRKCGDEWDRDEGTRKEMRLSTMMSLPEDEGHDEYDYHRQATEGL